MGHLRRHPARCDGLAGPGRPVRHAGRGGPGEHRGHGRRFPYVDGVDRLRRTAGRQRRAHPRCRGGPGAAARVGRGERRRQRRRPGEDLRGRRPAGVAARRQRRLLHHLGRRRRPGHRRGSVRGGRPAGVVGGRLACGARPRRRRAAAADRGPVHHGHRAGRLRPVRGAGHQPRAGQGPQLRPPRRRPDRAAPPRHDLHPGRRPGGVHPAFRTTLPTGSGVQVELDAHGTVLSTGARGAPSPSAARCCRAPARRRRG